MFLSRLLEIVELEFHALAGNQQIGFDLRQPSFQLGIELLDNNGFAVAPVVDIFCQSALNAHRFTQALAVDTALINPLATLPQDPAKLAKALEQHRQIAVLYVFAGSQAERLQFSGRDFANAGDFTQRQRFQKSRNVIRCNDVLPVGLVQIRGNFGEELHRCNSCGSRQIQLVKNGLADFLRHQGSRAVTMQAVRDVEIGFVKRKRFNQRGIAGKDFPNANRGFFIGIKTPRQQNEMRAKLKRHRRGHGATHAKFARRIVGGADYPALNAAAADGNRDIPQRRIITHLHGSKKAVHIDMDYFAHTQPSHSLDKYTVKISKLKSAVMTWRSPLFAHFLV
ncbi:hypothetical protein D3C71_876940 [compost metagenome]